MRVTGRKYRRAHAIETQQRTNDHACKGKYNQSVPLGPEKSFSDELTILELLAGFGGSPAEEGGEIGSSGTLEDSFLLEEMPSPSDGAALYRMGDVDSSPADIMAASSSCLEGRSMGALRCATGFDTFCRPHVAAAFLTDGNSLTFSLSSSIWLTGWMSWLDTGFGLARGLRNFVEVIES